MECKHCGSSAGIARENELSTDEWFVVCEDLAELGCTNVCLMGGEPFVREDWYDIAWCVKDLGMNLAFVTNGILVPNVLKDLSILEPNVVGISLDGTKKTHDYIRRKGSFETAMKAIDLLLEEGIQTTIITTLSKTNFKELTAIRDILKEKEVNWQLQTGMPFGNFDPSLVISEEEYYASAMFIAKEWSSKHSERISIVGAHCYGYHSHLLPNNKTWKGCTAGISSLGINSSGGVSGCLTFGSNQFVEGNVRERRLTQIWEDPNLFSYTRNFSNLQLGENCVNCFYGPNCKGGCNSTSLHLTGKMHNSPFCLRRIEEQLFEVKVPRRERLVRE
jgi:radical SAM protein with 4Fe4S-binding SPASM domain